MKSFYEIPGVSTLKGVNQGPLSLPCALYMARLHLAKKKWVALHPEMGRDDNFRSLLDPSDRSAYKKIYNELRGAKRSQLYQIAMTRDMLFEMRIDQNTKAFPFDMLDDFQKILRPFVRVFVFQVLGTKTELIYKGDSPALECVFLMCDESREKFGVATSKSGLSSKRYFCTSCCSFSKEKSRHSCVHICDRCGRPKSSSCDDGTKYQCDKCNRTFYSLDCFHTHAKLSSNGNGSRCTARSNG